MKAVIMPTSFASDQHYRPAGSIPGHVAFVWVKALEYICWQTSPHNRQIHYPYAQQPRAVVLRFTGTHLRVYSCECISRKRPLRIDSFRKTRAHEYTLVADGALAWMAEWERERKQPGGWIKGNVEEDEAVVYMSSNCGKKGTDFPLCTRFSC